MINITLPDGSQRSYENGITAYQVALSISEGLARNVLAAEINGEVWDANRAIHTDVNLKLLTWNDDKGKSTFWHSSAHIMAEALEALYPGTKFGIGPAIETGFYYDVDFGDREFSSDEFKKIEEKILSVFYFNLIYNLKKLNQTNYHNNIKRFYCLNYNGFCK
jgi:threonyl-tRNA synthetase